MRRTQGERTSPLCLMKRQQDCCERVASVSGFRMGCEAGAEVPRLVVKRRVVPRKEFNHAVAQHEIIVIAFAWQPASGLWGILASASRHGSTTLCGIHALVVQYYQIGNRTVQGHYWKRMLRSGFGWGMHTAKLVTRCAETPPDT